MLELRGTIVHTKNRYHALMLNPSAAVVDDSFDSLLVFSEAVRSGEKAPTFTGKTASAPAPAAEAPSDIEILSDAEDDEAPEDREM